MPLTLYIFCRPCCFWYGACGSRLGVSTSQIPFYFALYTCVFRAFCCDIYALGRAHNLYVRLRLRVFPSISFETVPVFVCLTMTLSLSLLSFQGRSSSASSFHGYLLQAIDGVMSLVLCQQTMTRAHPHFRSPEKQATGEGCFAYQSVCSVISLHSGIPRKYIHGSF